MATSIPASSREKRLCCRQRYLWVNHRYPWVLRVNCCGSINILFSFQSSQLLPTDSPDDQEQYSDPDCCITLHGLTLHGAVWNTERQCLELQSDAHHRTEDCSVLLSPVSQEHSYSEGAVLHCPVLIARELRGEPDPRTSPLLHVSLEAESATAVCSLEGRVYFTCHP